LSEVTGPKPAILKFKEFAPKTALRLLHQDSVVLNYFPDDALKPTTLFSDRVFTWSVLFSLRPEWSQKYYEEVLQFHSKKPAALEEKQLRVSENWLQQLQKFDVLTT
jgi:hypothetical protein